MISGTFLGTGTSQGVPVIGCHCSVCQSDDPKDRRLRTSFHVQSPTTSVVIDAGPDFRQQILRAGIEKLDAILLTHEHNDHVAGLDDVRPFNFLQQRDMPVFGLPHVLEDIRKRFAYAFDSNPYPGAPRYELIPLERNSIFQVGDITFEAIEVNHGNMPVLGFRTGSLTYITDAKTVSEETKEKIRGCENLVLNALRHKPHYSHLHLAAAIELANQCEVENTWFTHISHEMGHYNKVMPTLPIGFALAYDSLTLPIS